MNRSILIKIETEVNKLDQESRFTSAKGWICGTAEASDVATKLVSGHSHPCC